MKKTEHVPSTGRPSSREGEPTSCDRPSPPQELPSNLPPPPSPSPHHSVRDSHIPCTSHLRAPLHHPLTTRPLLNRCPALPRETHTHVHVCSFPYLPPCPFTSSPPRPSPLAPSSCSSCCWVTVRAPIILLNLPNIHTHTQEGRQGIPEGDD